MSENVVVKTSLGKVRGRLQPKVSDGKQVHSFSSIPFAEPPVGNLRFELPRKAKSWEGILDGTKYSPQPLQDRMIWDRMATFIALDIDPDVDPSNMSEDCLYLTVYTTDPSKSARLPVLFWLYGGDFKIGSQNNYNAGTLCSLHDVVVIIPNYRVNVFGLLSLGTDTNYSGNMALFDQIMALKWAKDNIEAFGGNPDNITIFGESAGGISVNCLMSSPLSHGLFHRAISHSGTSYMQGFPSDDLADVLKPFLESLQIEEKDPDKLIKRLKDIPGEKLLEAQKDLQKQGKSFSIIADGKFFPENPHKLHDDGKLQSLPYMIGCNNTEYHGVITLSVPGFVAEISKDNCKETLKYYFVSMFKMEVSDSKLDDILKEYGKNLEDGDKFKWSRLLGNVLADVNFVFPTMKTAIAQAKYKRKTYLYQMTQTLKCNHDLAYGIPQMMKAPYCKCDHIDDVIFTFGFPLSERRSSSDFKFSEDEKKLSAEWMKYITNFARHGDPNVGSPVQVKWPAYCLEEQAYLSVQHPCSVKKDLAADRLKFWNEVVEPKSK